MIVPERRGRLEQFQPEIRSIHSDPGVSAKNTEWARSRHNFIGATRTHPVDVDPSGLWQGHYFRGTSVDGSEASEHQSSLRILPFSDVVVEGDRDFEKPQREGRQRSFVALKMTQRAVAETKRLGDPTWVQPKSGVCSGRQNNFVSEPQGRSRVEITVEAVEETG